MKIQNTKDRTFERFAYKDLMFGYTYILLVIIILKKMTEKYLS